MRPSATGDSSLFRAVIRTPMTQPLPLEILFGIYLGVLTGMFPALVSWGLGFLFKYVTGVSIPAFGVVVLALALAGISR